jgi:ATP-binding cassette subfamily B protein
MAVLCGAPILLVDECTSALDENTEKTVLSNIKAKGGITAILISHRPAALEICDKVYAIQGGVAVEK